MKKFCVSAFLVTAVAIVAIAGSYVISGKDSFAIGNNAGYRTTADRSVFIGPGAGSYGYNMDSNVVIGAAAAVDAHDVWSSIAFGHYSMRGAMLQRGVVAIGDMAAYDGYNNSDSIMIGDGAGSGAYNTKRSVFVGSGVGSGAANISNAVCIGYGLVPTNNTVNIGGRIVCDDDGLRVNGVELSASGVSGISTPGANGVTFTVTGATSNTEVELVKKSEITSRLQNYSLYISNGKLYISDATRNVDIGYVDITMTGAVIDE